MTDTTLDERLANLDPARRAVFQQLVTARGAATTRELAPSQRSVWFMDRMLAGRPLYNVTWKIDLAGDIDIDAFRLAVDDVVAAHESLRTRFTTSDGVAVQVVEPELHVDVPFHDLAATSVAERESELARLAAEAGSASFDIGRLPLLALRLVRTAVARHSLLLTMHHIVFDGISGEVLLRDLVDCYARRARQEQPELRPPQFHEFVAAQRALLASPDGDELLEYWQEQLRDAPVVVDLSVSKPRPPTQSFGGRTHRVVVPPDLVDRMMVVASAERSSLLMGYMALVQLLVARYSGATDVCVGTPAANRPRPEWGDVVGLCTNMLVVRTDLGSDPSFRVLLGRVRTACLDAYEHQEVPFDRVVEAVAPERSVAHNPLFQIACALTPAPTLRPGAPLALLAMQPVHTGYSKFDLSLPGIVGPEGIEITIEYATDLFEPDAIVRMGEHLLALWRAATADPDASVWTLALEGHACDAPLGSGPGEPDGALGELGLVSDDRLAVLGVPGSPRHLAESTAAALAGATTCAAPVGVLADPAALARFLEAEEVTAAWLPTGVARALDPGCLRRLRLLVLDADAHPFPVEATFVVSSPQHPCAALARPVGAALRVDSPGVDVVDRAGRTAVGLTGRLTVAGTPTRFSAGRLPDGSIEVRGPVDAVAVVGGVPVDRTVVERAVLSHGGFRQVAVVAEPSTGSLVAYVVRAPACSADGRELQAHLADSLPRYLLPGRVVALDGLPLTDRGEVDLASLPAEGSGRGQSAPTPPRDALESLVALVWSDLFDGEPVDMLDNFFTMGGHSVLALRLLGEMAELFGVELPITVLFGAPTPAALSERVAAALGGRDAAVALATEVLAILDLSDEEALAQAAALPA